MPGLKKKYDFIASLGGNCAVAHNLLFRHKRPFSLPFDWVYMKDERPLFYLATEFSNRFSTLALKENLKQMPKSKDHSIIYQDTRSGYYFPNHFATTIEKLNIYEEFSKKLSRRIERFFSHIIQSDTMLFLLSLNEDDKITQRPLLLLQQKLQTLYPNKIFDFYVLVFNSKRDEISQLNPHIWWHRIHRPLNRYDFVSTNPEWAFLDEVDWTHLPKVSRLSKKNILFECRLFIVKILYHLRMLFYKKDSL